MIASGARAHAFRFFTAATLVAASLPCLAADRAAAARALAQGEVDQAMVILRAPNMSGPDHLLLCRAFYAEEMADEAINECEQALATLSSSSEAQDWAGRAYGMKAQDAGPISGLSLARKVRASFEAAVQLDPKSVAAANDLSEYYVAAPSVVGGGLDRAESLAARVEHTMPQAYHRMRGLIAEKRKDYGTAENEFRAAVGAGGHPDAWVDLGAFYFRRNQPDNAVAALNKAVLADGAKDASLVDAASLLEQYHREPALAERWLRLYLDSGTKSDAAPAFKAHTQLGQILKRRGDNAGAKIEFSKALTMASGYWPAKKAMQGL